MGVPGLWPFIRDRFGKEAVRRFQRGEKQYKFNYVYLDANGLLHAAAQKIYNYGGQKRMMDPYVNKTDEEKQTAVFETFFDNIIEVTSMAIPTDLLYIAIDGPAPRAKQNQQRERRFIASQIRLADEIKNGKSKFDSNSITPGTEFMHRLSEFMYWKIRDTMQNKNTWRTISVIFSPPTIPGEGEHKIMNYIRNLSEQERKNSTHCMFGPDGDLLMLTLAAHVEKMSLFREDQFEAEFYDLVDMNEVRKGLSRIFGQWKGVGSTLRTEHDVSNDFIFMGFFVGNDFIPKIKMFYRLDEGIEKMFNVYIETTDGGRGDYITKNKNILVDGFRKFVQKLSIFENDQLLYQSRLVPEDPKFIDKTLKSCVYRHWGELRSELQIDFKNYRLKYYNKFGITGKNEYEFEANVRKLCGDYFRNLVWIYLYYIDGLPSWEEAYTHHYAPLLKDFARYLENITPSYLEVLLNFDKDRPSLPFEQLLSVLPPASAILLPEEFQSLMVSQSSPLVQQGYYPSNFSIDYEGKRREHEGIALLPFVDHKIVSKAYEEVNEKLKYKWHRNESGNECIFRWMDVFTTQFNSRYGMIKKCNVYVSHLKNT